MKEMNYDDGYGVGITIAENSIEIWKNEKGTQIPWPKEVSEIKAFVETTIPAMNQAVMMQAMKEAREVGIEDPRYLPIPREYLRGVEDGYRERLSVLVYQFIQKEEWEKNRLVYLVSPGESPPGVLFRPLGSYVFIKAGFSPFENGFAKRDGTFTVTFLLELENIIRFSSAQSAIAWAEAAPRYWKVVNKAKF